MKCDNCSQLAKYELKDKSRSQLYCATHLPWFIKVPRDLGTKVFEVSSTPAVVTEEPVLEMNRAIHGSTMKETAPEAKKPAKKKKETSVKDDAVEEVKEEALDEEK